MKNKKSLWTNITLIILVIIAIVGFFLGGYLAGWDFSYWTNPNTIIFFVLISIIIILFVGLQIYKSKRG